VQPVPTTCTKYPISFNGGTHYPLWSPDGNQIFYVIDRPNRTGQIVSVNMQTQPTFVVGKTTSLPIDGIVFNGREAMTSHATVNTSLSFPKRREKSGAAASEQINVTLNWFAELRQRVPVK
jgi:Tol biopolymer transport system component